MSQISNQPDGMWKTNGKEALQHLTARYASLSIYADKIMKQARLTGTSIPCHILNAYNEAVNDYLSYGRRLFDLLHKNKMNVEQVIYKDGRPQVDAAGNLRTLRIDAPLRPLTFVLTKTECQNLTRVSTTGTTLQGDEIGLPLIPIGMLAAYVISGIAVTGVIGVVSVAILEKLIIVLRGPVYTPDQVVSAYTKCLDGVSATVEKTYKNLPAAEKEKIAAQLQMECRGASKGESGSSLPVIALIGALGVGGYFFLSKKGG